MCEWNHPLAKKSLTSLQGWLGEEPSYIKVAPGHAPHIPQELKALSCIPKSE